MSVTELASGSLKSLARLTQGRDRLVELRLTQIEPDPAQPRKSFSEESLKELAATIQAHGLIQKIVVRPGESDGRYVIVSGERRFRACQIAKHDPVLCVVQSATDDAQLLMRQGVENLQREDLSLLEVAALVGRLVDEFKLRAAEVAAGLGKHPSFVSRHLTLYRDDGLAREAVEERLIESIETYDRFRKLSPRRQKAEIARARAGAQPIVRAHVKARRKPRKRAAATKGVRLRRALTPNQARILIVRLGGTPPSSDGDLGSTLKALLDEVLAGNSGSRR